MTATGTGSISGTLQIPEFAKVSDGQWRMAAGDYANTRFSSLDQITPQNAASLKMVWKFDTGLQAGHEAAPLVVGDRLYITTPFPNMLHAFDLSGRHQWTYDPKANPAARGEACCDWVNRGAAFDQGRIFYNTLDGHTIAVDAMNGEEVWKTKVADLNKGETLTMAPIVAEGRVMVGTSGGELGVRGWIAGLDEATGQEVWRGYSTGPDAEVLIGERFHPFYDMDRGKDLGVASWPPGQWRMGGGTVWGWVSYDPDLHLIYYGTGNPGPWNPDQRAGDNKWTSGVFARSPVDGQASWFYQITPHDEFDYDGVNEAVLLDLMSNGNRRRVMLRADRDGYFYVMDRETGEVLSANPFVHITTSRRVDLKTGRVDPVKEKSPRQGRLVRDICPSSPGGKDWTPMAFSPRTGLTYIPHNNLCQDVEGTEVSYIAGTPYLGANVRMYAGPGGNRGDFTAWDAVAGKPVWNIHERFPVWSGALVTGGDVVFYGTMDGYFKALDAKDGRVLWSFHAPSGFIGQPITYRGADGKQYVAIYSGVGGWAGASVSARLDPRDPTAALGFNGAMADLAHYSKAGGTLYVFALP